jgi:hypothetical protein
MAPVREHFVNKFTRIGVPPRLKHTFDELDRHFVTAYDSPEGTCHRSSLSLHLNVSDVGVHRHTVKKREILEWGPVVVDMEEGMFERFVELFGGELELDSC